ncbi:hypothetical protein [Phaeodactylibacter xiamenensis]|uniref:hypothetical protein n=1 Tax=Phaeodactylibacter xiamenensis TaxID=1524460 RepID=UPI0024A966BD|nr:hypothetical protein [Phaeodactylibacter xiamenensis]
MPGLFYCPFPGAASTQSKRKNEKKLHGRHFARIFTIIKLFSKMEETSFLDTLTGKESIKVEHIVTTPISTIIYIVAGVALARVVSSFFDK